MDQIISQKQAYAADLASKAAAVHLKKQEIREQQQLVIKLEAQMKQMLVDEQVLSPRLHETCTMQPISESGFVVKQTAHHS